VEDALALLIELAPTVNRTLYELELVDSNRDSLSIHSEFIATCFHGAIREPGRRNEVVTRSESLVLHSRGSYWTL